MADRRVLAARSNEPPVFAELAVRERLASASASWLKSSLDWPPTSRCRLTSMRSSRAATSTREISSSTIAPRLSRLSASSFLPASAATLTLLEFLRRACCPLKHVEHCARVEQEGLQFERRPALQLTSWNTGDGMVWFTGVAARNIIGVSFTALVCVARRHPSTLLIEQASDEQGSRFPGAAPTRLLTELRSSIRCVLVNVSSSTMALC